MRYLLMIVNEIFDSIEGEGKRTGQLVTFIRLAGCNLRCSYCDTDYALKRCDGDNLPIPQIVDKVGYQNVTITGGEPLFHPQCDKLVSALLMDRHIVNIETNGSIPLEGLLALKRISSGKLFFTMDYKLPSSGMCHEMHLPNLAHLTETDVLKFVVGDHQDLLHMVSVLNDNPVRAQIYISPVFGQIDLREIVDFMKLHNIVNAKVQIQLHKIIWHAEMRGV